MGEIDAEGGEVLLMGRAHLGHDLLLGTALLAGADHGGGAMHVVGAAIGGLVAHQALEAHPDVRLDVFHQVADVDVAVDVREGGGDEQALGHGRDRQARRSGARHGAGRFLVAGHRRVRTSAFGGQVSASPRVIRILPVRTSSITSKGLRSPMMASILLLSPETRRIIESLP